MPDQQPDVIVIGAGVAGMAAAALLSQDHRQRVLVVEQAPFIGGRTFSVVGRGRKVEADGIEMDAREFRKAMGYARCRIARSTPDLETIFEQGLLDGVTFEAGAHGLFWGEQNRAHCLLEHLGERMSMPLNRGFAFVEWRGSDRAGIAHQVRKGQGYEWMSPEGYQSTMTILRAMNAVTREQLRGLMSVSLETWLAQFSPHPEAYAYLKVLAASQTVQAEPSMTPAGDFLGYMAVARDIGMNLVKGSVGVAAPPGPIGIALAMEQAILAHGGRVLRDTRVLDVRIEGAKVRGLRIRTAAGEERALEADRIICTLPSRHLFNVLPRSAFPADWVRELEQEHWGAGIMTGWGLFKRPVWADIGIDPSSFVFMPRILDQGYIGAVDMVMTELSAWGQGQTGRVPPGLHDFVFSTALTDREMRDPAKVDPVIDACEGWARATFPTWDEDLICMIWTPAPEGYGYWRPVGRERPDVVSEFVEGLYFAGDQYGKRLWGGGVDAACLSAVLCVDRMMGGELEERIFPPYHRGLV